MSSIRINNICKKFGKKTVLSDVCLNIPDNCIYGLLGRNGAGKSTLMNIISNRIFANSGEVLIDDVNHLDNDEALSKIHMMSEVQLTNPYQRVKKFFSNTALFYPDYDMEYALKLCDEYKLDPKKRIYCLSTGYRSIAKIINALACNASVVILDEPVLGLDANHREMFYRQMLDHYNERPATYIISTHLIEEASGMIERAAMIKEGKVLLDEDCETIRSMGYSVSGKISDVDNFICGRDVMSEQTIGGLKTAYIKGDRTKTDIPASLETAPLSLQTLFIHLTNS